MKEKITRVVKYLNAQHVLGYPGGIPTSMRQSGQQWDSRYQMCAPREFLDKGGQFVVIRLSVFLTARYPLAVLESSFMVDDLTF